MEIAVETRDRHSLLDITAEIQDAVTKAGWTDGLCHVFVPHTTAGVLLNEAFDPGVRADILSVLDEMIPAQKAWRHAEGNSPAHAKAVLAGSAAWIPVQKGRLQLGTWQGVFLAEFDGPRRRRVILAFVPAQF